MKRLLLLGILLVMLVGALCAQNIVRGTIGQPYDPNSQEAFRGPLDPVPYNFIPWPNQHLRVEFYNGVNLLGIAGEGRNGIEIITNAIGDYTLSYNDAVTSLGSFGPGIIASTTMINVVHIEQGVAKEANPYSGNHRIDFKYR